MYQDFQYFQSFLFTDKRTLEYVTDKSKSSASIINYMLARLQKMFRYKNLPDSIPRQYLENYLLVNGSCIIAKDKKNPSDDSIYAFVGAAGGEPDIYYRPTKYMVANPSLNFSAEYYISTTDPNHEPDAILIRNDTMWQGLYPMMARYASLIAENLLTIRTADVMLRILALITAPDDPSRLAADQYLKDIQEGKLASIGENRFLDGIRMQNPPSNNGSYLTQFIELHQYLVGSFYNEVGLNANYNMKREALSESETGLNDDSLMPLCEDMLRCRREDIEQVNNMFGTSIEVDFDSSWLENEIDRLLNLQSQATEASSQLETPAALEVGMEDVELEGASMEEVGEPGDVMDEESGKEDSEDNEMEEDEMEDKKDPGLEDESGDDDRAEEDGMEDEEPEKDVEEDSGLEEAGLEVEVDVRIKEPADDFMNPPVDKEDDADEDDADENGNESGRERGEEEKEDED